MIKRAKSEGSVITDELLERIKEVVIMLDKDRTGLKKILIVFEDDVTFVKVYEEVRKC